MNKKQMIKKYELYLSYTRKEYELAMQGVIDFSNIDPIYAEKIKSKANRLSAKMEVAEQVLIDLHDENPQ